MPHLRDIAVAFAFLTRIPIGVPHDPARPLARAAWAFPLAGVVVGGIGGAMAAGAAALGLPAGAGALLAVGAMAVTTGALHEDGLADVADGFGGGRDRESALAIMRDSRIGSFGAIALIVVIGLRVVAVSESIAPLNALVLAAVLGRTAVVPAMAWLPNARADGLGAGAGKPGGIETALAVALGVATAAVLAPAAALLAVAAAVGAALAVGLISLRKIGGMTGDTLGATEQVAETAVLMALLVV